MNKFIKIAFFGIVLASSQIAYSSSGNDSIPEDVKLNISTLSISSIAGDSDSLSLESLKGMQLSEFEEKSSKLSPIQLDEKVYDYIKVNTRNLDTIHNILLQIYKDKDLRQIPHYNNLKKPSETMSLRDCRGKDYIGSPEYTGLGKTNKQVAEDVQQAVFNKGHYNWSSVLPAFCVYRWKSYVPYEDLDIL